MWRTADLHPVRQNLLLIISLMNQIAELRVSPHYLKEHPWVIQGITGFLSAYFMEKPGFQVQRHFDEIASGMHVWVCELPPNMKMTRLTARLQADIPPSTVTDIGHNPDGIPQFLLDLPSPDLSNT